MSEEKKVMSQDAVSKSLADLLDLAKSSASRGTPATKVETQTGVGSDNHAHPGLKHDGETSTWAGSSYKQESEGDAVDANGTDYNGGASMVKGFLEKIAKGELDPAVGSELIKAAKKAFGMDMEDDKEDDKEDTEKACKKSIMDEARENEEVAKGFEVSDFLEALTETLAKSIEARFDRLEQKLDSDHKATGGYQAAMAKSLAHFGEAVAAQTQRIAQVEAGPARAPKSIVSGAQVIEKGMGSDNAPEFTHRQIADALADCVIKGLVPHRAVLDFESSKQISQEHYNLAAAQLAGK